MPIQLQCPNLNFATEELSIRLPGGAAISALQQGLTPYTLPELTQSLFAQLSTALAGLEPVFAIVEVIQVIFETIKAVATLNPVEIADQLPKLVDAVAAIASIFPPVGMILTISDSIKALIAFIRGIIGTIEIQIQESIRIANAQLVADNTGFDKINDAILCAVGLQQQFTASLNDAFKPISTIIGVLNTFMQIIGLGQFQIPTISNIDASDFQGVKDVLDATDEFLGVIATFLP